VNIKNIGQNSVQIQILNFTKKLQKLNEIVINQSIFPTKPNETDERCYPASDHRQRRACPYVAAPPIVCPSVNRSDTGGACWGAERRIC
jgi:hypothetical protein